MLCEDQAGAVGRVKWCVEIGEGREEGREDSISACVLPIGRKDSKATYL